MREFDDSQVMAYADGVLEAETAGLIAAAAAADPTLRSRIEVFRASTQVLRSAFDPVIDAPVPARLLRAAGADPMARSWRSRASIALQRTGVGLALAASVALGVTVLLRAPPTGVPAPAIALGVEAEVLEHQPSGEPKTVTAASHPVEVLVLATYRTPDGRFCRSYELVQGPSLQPQRKLGCRGAEGGWFAERTIASVSPGADVYAPAGGGAGIPDSFTALDFEQETRVLQGGWRP